MNNFKALYEQYKNRVYNLALHYVQNTEDAEEITQDVFIQIYEKHHTFREESSFGTWVYRITINQSLNFIRAKSRQKRFAIFSSLFHFNEGSLKHDQFDFNHPGILMEEKESMKILFTHINDLPVQQRTVLILMKIENKSQKEVSEILEISAKAVESLMQRAKVNLRKKLNQTKENEK
ncbi:MAG: RNA polymerase sigma factor [Bacteroidota bacterium]|nr:RNA polymerase sigma factor [Bacteroidota bacterium]